MNNTFRITKDDEFEPNEIKSRLTYRKLRIQVKDELAKLYYGKNVKMAKLVKKFKISFSTLTDILKKYDQNGDRLEQGFQKVKKVKSKNQGQDSNSRTGEAFVKMEASQLDHVSIMMPHLQTEYTPEYIFYPV